MVKTNILCFLAADHPGLLEQAKERLVVRCTTIAVFQMAVHYAQQVLAHQIMLEQHRMLDRGKMSQIYLFHLISLAEMAKFP